MLFTLCIYCNMAAYFSPAQNQYHINFPNKKRLTPTMNRKLHLHPGNFKLSNPWLFRNLMMITLSQGWDVSVLSKGEKDVLGLPGISSVVVVFIYRLPWVLIWLNTLNKSASRLTKRNFFSRRKALSIFHGLSESLQALGQCFYFSHMRERNEKNLLCKSGFKFPNILFHIPTWERCLFFICHNLPLNDFVPPQVQVFRGGEGKAKPSWKMN